MLDFIFPSTNSSRSSDPMISSSYDIHYPLSRNKCPTSHFDTSLFNAICTSTPYPQPQRGKQRTLASASEQRLSSGYPFNHYYSFASWREYSKGDYHSSYLPSLHQNFASLPLFLSLRSLLLVIHTQPPSIFL